MRSLVLFLTISAFSFSCTSIREARDARKSANAMSWVYLHPPLFETLGQSYIASHPISQAPIYIKGKDTIIYRVDSIPYAVVDSIRLKCPNLNVDSLLRLYTRTVYKHTTDTLKIPDTNSIRMVNIGLLREAGKDGQITQLVSQRNDLKKDNSKLKMWMWIGGLIGAIIIVFLSVLLIKRK